MNESSREAVIAGLGLTRLGRVFGSSQRRLAASAVRLAAADAGLSLSDLDGLLICPGITGGLDVGLAQVLGLRDLALLATVSSYGASAVMAVQTAALAVRSGSARAVACVFADTPLREGARAGSAFGGGSGGSAAAPRVGFGGLAGGYGFRSVTVHYALAARAHMQRFGTTSEQFGAVAVAQRQWAAGNPLAQYQEPITIADHQQSRWVAEPLHLLDCSLVSNGAIAVIVTSADLAAASGPKPPVRIWGWGQGHPGQPMARGSEFGLVTGAAQAGRAAMDMAGVTAANEVTMAQIYDCYTYTVLVTLEDYGFCRKGEGGPFAASGALAPGGALPVNTGGGQLSGYYMWGFTPLSEAIIQARGEGGARQAPAPATDLILVSGNGGILDHHGTLILSPHSRTAAPRRSRAARTPEPEPRLGPAAGPAHGLAAGWAGGAESVGVIQADARSAPFFAGAGRNELVIKRCERCDTWLPPSATSCPGCGDEDDSSGSDGSDGGSGGGLSWAAASGLGRLVSWAVVHPRAAGESLAIPALVELDEGPWLATGLRLADLTTLATLRAGLPVIAEFVHPPDGDSYPAFRPVTQSDRSEGMPGQQTIL